MICPYCNNPMVSGYIQACGEVYFTEEPHKYLLGHKAGEIVLTEKNMTAPTCKAYRCRDCRKVIVEYKERNEKSGRRAERYESYT